MYVPGRRGGGTRAVSKSSWCGTSRGSDQRHKARARGKTELWRMQQVRKSPICCFLGRSLSGELVEMVDLYSQVFQILHIQCFSLSASCEFLCHSPLIVSRVLRREARHAPLYMARVCCCHGWKRVSRVTSRQHTASPCPRQETWPLHWLWPCWPASGLISQLWLIVRQGNMRTHLRICFWHVFIRLSGNAIWPLCTT